jgi:hypothetical protein
MTNSRLPRCSYMTWIMSEVARLYSVTYANDRVELGLSSGSTLLRVELFTLLAATTNRTSFAC